MTTKSESSSASVGTFLSFLENPILRFIIRFSGNHHLKNGKSYLEAALDDLVGKKDKRYGHSLSRIIFSSIIKMAVDFGCIAFNVDKEETVNALKVPYFKKGLLNVLSGIGMYGVTSVQNPRSLPRSLELHECL